MSDKLNVIVHLLSRGASNLNLYDLHIAEDSATFMLYGVKNFLNNSPNIKPLGFQTYRPYVQNKKTNHPRDSRYFTYQPKSKVLQDTVVFGLERLENKPDFLYITEGIFEAMTLHRLGYPAIAVLTASPSKYLKDCLSALAKESVWAGDNDPAGNKSWLSKACDHRLLLDKDLDETPDTVIINAVSKIHCRR